MAKEEKQKLQSWKVFFLKWHYLGKDDIKIEDPGLTSNNT